MARGPFTCPVCGEEVPSNARACPECGACDRSGWNTASGEDGLDLPDGEEDFDYDKFLEEEFGTNRRRTGVPLLTWIIAIVVLFAFLAMMFHTFVGMSGR